MIMTEPEIFNKMNNGSHDRVMPAAGVAFEKGFMSFDLDLQISHCDHYELADYFRKWLPDHQPILEAGCGSGRWVAWFVKNGWRADGLDWSRACCERVRTLIPRARFEVGDMRAMPFMDGEFGAVVSLGAIEHSPEGPESALIEYRRALRDNGIAIITVPYLGLIKKISRFFQIPKKTLIRNRLLRRLLKKPGYNGRSIEQARKATNKRYASDFIPTKDGWEFYQYHFTKGQMREILYDCGFQIVDEFIEFGDEGIFHNFGRIAGHYDYEKGVVAFSMIGKMLRGVIPLNIMGNMLCLLVRKSSFDVKNGTNEYAIGRKDKAGHL